MGGENARLVKELKAFKEEVSGKYSIDKMILFGSRAKGAFGEDSDVDIIVVGEEFRGKSLLRRPYHLYLDWNLAYPVDFLCYTPEEFEERKERIGIIREALREGIAI